MSSYRRATVCAVLGMLLALSVTPFASVQSATRLNLVLTQGTAGSVVQAVGEGIGEAIRREYPGSLITVQAGSPVSNVPLVQSKQTDLAIAYASGVYAAHRGGEPYNKKMPDVTVIGAIFPSIAHVVVSESSGISSLDQIRLKKFPLRVSVNAKGTFMELSSRVLFESYGFTFQDIEKWGGKVYYLPSAKSEELFKTGDLDMFVTVGPAPVSRLIEIAATKKVRLLPVSKVALDVLREEFGAFSTKIAAGTYSFVKEDIPTYGDFYLLIARADLDDDVAYAVAKAIANQVEFLHSVHQCLGAISPEYMLKNIPQGVPLHPGAERYYREAGLLK